MNNIHDTKNEIRPYKLHLTFVFSPFTCFSSILYRSVFETKPLAIKANFQDLLNELIYERFDLLDYHHASDASYDLNNRFENLFLNSN